MRQINRAWVAEAHTLAGVTLALSVYFLVFLFALGVVTAITPIVAQARGRGETEGVGGAASRDSGLG